MSRVKEHRAAGFFGRTAERVLIAALIIAALWCLFAYWLVPVRVSGTSMAPSLEDGDVVLTDRLFRYGRGLKRGDLVAVRSADGELYIRRIVGLSGETLDIVDGELFIDGCPVEEDYLPGTYREIGMEPVTVPAGTFLLLSDDRRDGGDSRSADIGCVSQDDVYGLVRFRVWPSSRLNIFG